MRRNFATMPSDLHAYGKLVLHEGLVFFENYED